MDRRAPLAAALAPALALAACGGDPGGGGSFGRPCDDGSQCGADAPTCVALEAPDYAPGLCASACGAGGSCPAGAECHALVGGGDACVRCVASLAGTVGAGGGCGCDADCESGGTCEGGRCAIDCSVGGCPSGSACEGTPPTCRACLGGTARAEGETCSCGADCAMGLACVGDLCARACVIDEMCGADECRHELAVGPSCGAPDPACPFSGAGRVGDPCACNGDCGPTAPLCLGVWVMGERRRVCSSTCSPEMACDGGRRCCTGDGAHNYCVEQALADPVGARCL